MAGEQPRNNRGAIRIGDRRHARHRVVDGHAAFDEPLPDVRQPAGLEQVVQPPMIHPVNKEDHD